MKILWKFSIKKITEKFNTNICQILKFPESSQRKLSNFQIYIFLFQITKFQKLEKKLELEENPF